jgi:hypothetical protein
MRAALEAFGPDCLLVEGPPEATPLIALAADPEMVPPVAILAYDPDEPSRSGFYPFAEFSPEWQAVRLGLAAEIPVRFMDLSLAHALLLDRAAEVAALLGPGEGDEDAGGAEAEVEGAAEAEVDAPDEAADADPATDANDGPSPDIDLRLDPLGYIGLLAGEDGERWWERLVEERRDATDVFAAIALLIAELRDAVPTLPSDLTREAAMRTAIRAAREEGFERIAVVCGAWHAPALADLDDAPGDAARLRGLPRTKVATTWVPWSEGHLAASSGYGAGVESPGWYGHLWTTTDHLTERWMARVAGVLRDEGLDVSPAHLVEAARLADTLAALRGRAVPGLTEMGDATRSVMLFGSDVPLALIRARLIVGTALGNVPPSVETAPLSRDLAALQRRLRLPPETGERLLELDLRGETDLARSRLLHRLRLLDVPWGTPTADTRRAMGTFREPWRLHWDPAFAIALIAQSRWGNTIAEAAEARLRDEAATVVSVTALAARIEAALLADLPGAVAMLVGRLATASAVATDVTAQLDALPSLARSLRYGNVRGTDHQTLGVVTDGIVLRAAMGLGLAVASLDDDAAAAMVTRIENGEAAVTVLEREALQSAWYAALTGVADQRGVHGLVVGRVVRILLDRGRLDPDGVARRLSAAISRGATPPEAAAFLEGFLAGPGALLVHDPRLFRLIDDWLCEQPGEAFAAVLPLLRRTFSRFSPAERRTLGDRVRVVRGDGVAAAASAAVAVTDADSPVEGGEVATPAAEPATAPAAADPATAPAAADPATAPAATEPATAADTGPALDLLDDLLGLGGDS